MKMQANGSKIRTLRERRAWPQAQLAEIAGVSERTIQRVEQGESISFETLTSIASAFNIDVSEIVIRPKQEKPIDFLIRVSTGTELFNLVAGSHAGRYSHDDLRDEYQVGLVSAFLQDMQDYGDIWDDIGPGGQVKAKHEFTDRLAELEAAGLWVFVIRKIEKFKVSNQITSWHVTTIFVAKKDNPTIVSLPQQPAVFPAMI